MNAREAVLAAVEAGEGALFVSALGTATSALRAASADGPHLYLGGAMGCGLATALGVAERRPERQVVAVLGDGDLLMGAGSLWTLAALAPSNLAVLVLDDGRYAITGGQALVGEARLAAVAGAFPQLAAREVADRAGVADALRDLPRPALVVARVTEAGWPGPSPFVEPHEVRLRFTAAAVGA